MYDTLSLGSDNRRLAQRLRMRVFLNEYVGDDPCQAIVRDVSETGLSLANFDFENQIVAAVLRKNQRHQIGSHSDRLFRKLKTSANQQLHLVG